MFKLVMLQNTSCFTWLIAVDWTRLQRYRCFLATKLYITLYKLKHALNGNGTPSFKANSRMNLGLQVWATPDFLKVFPTLSCCVFVVLDEPGQTEVSDLAHQTFSNEDVGRAQVSVDVVHPLYVCHACCHLGNGSIFFFQ